MPESRSDIKSLLEVVTRLRRECPWDQKQTHETLSRHLIEESYEVVDAISELGKENSYLELKLELGDLLFQILLHSKIAEDKGEFNIGDVFESLEEKLIHRHPHVFEDSLLESAEEVEDAWEKRKQKECKNESIFDDIETNMSSLELAAKVQRKAKSIGLSYSSLQEAFDDFLSEVNEFQVSENINEQKDEFGDILFSLVNVSRLLETDTELELRNAVKRVISRAKYVESKKENTEQNLNELWSEAKKTEKREKEE